MASSTVPTLTLEGRNWKVYKSSLLEVAATKGCLGILSGQEPTMKFGDPTPISIPNKKPTKAPSDNEMQEMCMKPSKLSKELPNEDKLGSGLTNARSEDEAEAAVEEAQQCMAQNELHEQPSSRAGEQLESEHKEVLSGLVKMPDKVKIVSRKAELASKAACRINKSDVTAHEDLPMKPCDGSTKNNMPSANALLLEGEHAACTSSSVRQHKRLIKGWRGSAMVHI
ncbi:hypothetical protein F5141DRAFT_1061604 [Pisolithus sp. B1]|nr:hypothetical protein EV401DRAFT_1895718 [Pisolithus croceorrhizus]KAI6122043.1 hypothetical protein F5141DRAFT_1061604 [Pisolithus sp. B1]